MPFLTFLRDNARWIAAAFVLTFFSTVGQTSFIGGSAGHIRSEYGLGNGEWGLVYMVGTLASALTLPYLGAIVDRLTVRKVLRIVAPGLAVAAALMALSPHVVGLVFAIFLLRLFGQGMFPHTAYTATARWFTAQRGKALSLVILGHNAGEAVLISGFVALSAMIGWRMGWLVLAALVLVVALPLVWWLARVERVPRASEVNPRVVDARDWTRAEVLRDPIFYLSMLGFMAPGFIVTVIFFHQVYLVELRGWSLGVFASAFIVWAVVNSMFTILSGLVLLPFVLLPLGAACFVLGVIEAWWAPFLFMAMVGMSNGLSTTLFGAVWPEIYGLKHLGSIRAIGVSAGVLASAAGPGLTGYLIDAGVPYPHQLVAMGLYCGVASGVLGYVSSRVRRRTALDRLADPT
ncbi:MAG: MFS transporter [Mesorhizobium sp.]|nr:MFS transporter [Mesorhizobium sp.]MCO5164521.1 MFS transporter [Mesorhizobium sp.]